MSVQQPPPRSGAGHTPASPASPRRSPQLRKDVRPLGEALKARVDEVLEVTLARTGGQILDAAAQESFDRLNLSATVALAGWLAGEGAEAVNQAGRDTTLVYSELADRRAASLQYVTMRCLRWRDTVAEVLQEGAVELGVSAEALTEALRMLQGCFEFSLDRMATSFDTEHQRTDDELAFLGTHDALTGLPNRTLILDRTEQLLVRARRHQTPVAALWIGLDNFKSVNETLSHAAGDQLLRAVGERLDGVIRDTDALGRLGGDEFIVICEELSPTEGPELIAGRLQDALKEQITLTGEHAAKLTVTASIGIATVPRASADEFLRDADIAMHQAKWDGKNRCVSFEPGMQDAVQSRMELEMDLRDALKNDEFFLVYQPTFNLSDMALTGTEALIRWRHPARGIVQPNDFIPLLEDTGLIVEVGKWVLREATRQGAVWREAGHSIRMALNVSGRQLDSDEFVTDVRSALSESGLEASALTLEITETTLMRDIEKTARRLTAIRALGVRIAIDDFGTGYSSLAHLQRFQVDALKIDRSFVSRLTENREGETLMHTLVQLGKALSIETLAEGIELEQELSILQDEQCDSGQGFLFARPLEVQAAEAFLESWPTGVAPVSGTLAPVAVTR